MSSEDRSAASMQVGECNASEGRLMSDFIEKLKQLKFDLSDDSVVLQFAKKAFAHISRYISPLLSDHGENAASILALRLLCALRATSDDTNPTAPFHSVIAKIWMLKTNKENSNLQPATSNMIREATHDSVYQECSTAHIEPQQLLIGRLSNVGTIKKHLYLCDTYGRMLCHIAAPDPKYNHAFVVITKWRYISAEYGMSDGIVGYVEVLSEPIVLRKAAEVGSPTRKRLHTLAGLVTSVSSCTDFRKWQYFVKLKQGEEHKLILLENTFWASCMQRGNSVRIHRALRCKLTLEKGLYEIFKVADYSQLEILDSMGTINSQLTKSQFISQAYEKIKTVGAVDETCGGRKCVDYIGEVTDVICARLAIFSLDCGKAVLHCTYNTVPDFGCAIRGGAVVIVSSAHSYMDSKNVTHLVCCTRSSVAVIRHSEKESRWKPICVIVNPLLREYLLKEDFLHHPVQMISLVNFVKHLYESFPVLANLNLIPIKIDGLDKDGGILRKLLFEKQQLNTNNSRERSRRSLIDEVLSDPHSCIALSAIEKPCFSYRLLTVQKLKEFILLKAKIEYGGQPLPDFWMEFGWRCMLWNQDLFFLGQLQGDPLTGRINLFDQTGGIECVIIENVNTYQDSPHAKPLKLCANHKGCLVRIRNCHMICLCMADKADASAILSSADLPSTSELKNETPEAKVLFHPYIVCSVENMKVLRTEDGSKEALSTLRCCHETLCSASDKRELDEQQEGPSAKRQKIDNDDESVLLGNESMVVFVTKIRPVKEGNFTVHGYLLERKSKLEEASLLPVISLKFVNNATWHPFISTGVVLKLEISNQGEQKEVLVNENDVIKHLQPSECSRELNTVAEVAREKWMLTQEKIYSVSEAIQQSFVHAINLRGRIVSKKTYFEKQSLCHRLDICDADPSADYRQLSVYLGRILPFSSCYGLMAGAIIRLAKCNIVKSRIGNIYAKYTPNISAMYVERIPMRRSITPNDPEANESNILSMPEDPCSPSEIADLEDGELFNCSKFPCMYVSSMYASQLQFYRGCRSGVVKLKLHSSRILNATIRIGSDMIRGANVLSFHAKCIASDHTGRIYLHFNDVDNFFRFIEIPAAVKNEILSVCRRSSMLEMKYDYVLHDGNNIAMNDLSSLNDTNSSGLCALIFLCNQVNTVMLDMKDVAVRQICQSDDSNLYTSATSLGEQNRMLTYKLKLCSFNCIKVL